MTSRFMTSQFAISHFLCAAVSIAAGLALANTANAQYGQGGNFGQQQQGGAGGAFGGGGGGTGVSSSSGAFGQRTMGGGSAIGASQGQGFGGSAMGQGFGTGQGGTGFNNLQSVGVGTGAGGFAQQSFVGGDPSMAGSFVGGIIQSAANGGRTGMNGMNGGIQGLQGFGQQGNRQNQQRQQQQFGGGGGQQNNRASTTKSVRTTYMIDFDHPTITTSKVAAKLSTELTKSRSLSALGPLTVDMDGRTAILRGVVATDHDRSLAERLALLEPGVSQIQNELEVKTARPLTPEEQRVRSRTVPTPPAPQR